MTMLIENPRLEEDLIEQCKAWGVDQHDEVWEGVYFMSPLPNDEHQKMVTRFTFILELIIGIPELGEVRAGVNLAGSSEDWKYDFRAPDVVVFLRDTKAENCDAFWRGPADFVIEITSPGDRTYDKIPFYSRLGVRELLVVDRQRWAVELHRHDGGELTKVGESILDKADLLSSTVLPLRFQLLSGTLRPQIEVTHLESGQSWRV